METAAIETRNLVKKFNKREPVLDGVSFSIEKGEFVTIYGKSGCGKTTLLNIIGGLDRPSSGEVLIAGMNITELTEDELALLRLNNIGFVFQDFNLLTDLNVRENVALPLRFSGRADGGRVDDMLERFDIKNLAEERANRISGGEAQRAAIARAMMNSPSMILADEPTGNLDAENTDNVISIFQDIRKDFGTTIVLATHDMSLSTNATKKIVLEGGKAILGSPG